MFLSCYRIDSIRYFERHSPEQRADGQAELCQNAANGRGISVVTPIDSPQLLQFGVFEVDRGARELRKQGIRIRLQEQPFQVLVLLLQRAGEVVTRKELREKLWPSSVYVDFDHGLNNAITRLREALGDSAAAPHFVETLPRLGYRFIYPLRIPAGSAGVLPAAASLPHPEAATVVANDTEQAIDVPPRGASRWTRRRQIIAGSTMAVVAVLVLGLWLTGRVTDAPTADAALPEAPSVAVLPFVNMSPNPENEYFTDGLSEELANKLAGIRGLKVAAQTSAFHFKGKHEPAAVIAEALNVNHLLEGSVRQSGTRMRVTAQLVDAASGYHLWSESFDREFTDVFRIQEEIAIAVADTLQVKLVAADNQRLHKHGTRDAEAYRLYLIARAQISWVFDAPDWAAVKQSLEAAIARDPNFAAAHAFLAHYYYNRVTDVESDARLGRAAAERAVALDPELSDALGARAIYAEWRYRYQGDFDAYRQASRDFRRALELDPSNAQASFHYARAAFWNEPDLALSLYEQTLQIDPTRYSAEGQGAILLSRRGQHDEARRRIQVLYERNPGQKFHNAINIAALAYYLGQLDEAVFFLRETMPRGLSELPIHLWALDMSLGDKEAANAALELGNSGLAGVLAEAARHCMEERYPEAFDSLERRRDEFPSSRLLDVPTARLALIVNQPAHAAAILESRLPDLATGVEPVNARTALPALDLVASWTGSGKEAEADELLDRIAVFLDGSEAPQWPMFIYLRARAHALAGEFALAQQTLDRAYAAGFRNSWAVDVLPRPFLYIDPIHVDPAFDELRTNPRYQEWLAGIEADNARQLERLRARSLLRNAGAAGAR
jgi:TolB-like protein/DNA-binding winged helix-turn-helix (wHTH) protein